MAFSLFTHIVRLSCLKISLSEREHGTSDVTREIGRVAIKNTGKEKAIHLLNALCRLAWQCLLLGIFTEHTKFIFGD